MGIFIGGSLLYLYQVSISFLQRIKTKFKRSLGNSTTNTIIKEFEIESDDGKGEKRNEKISQITQNTTSTTTPNRIPENETSNEILFRVKEELEKQRKMLFKHDTKMNILKNKMREDYYNLKRKIKKSKSW